MKSSESSVPYETLADRNQEMSQVKGLFSMKEKFVSLCERSRFSLSNGIDPTQSMDSSTDNEGNVHGEKLSDQRLFSCATCGILSFDCIAIVQPREAAARYLMSADCSFFNDWIVGSGVINDGFSIANGSINTSDQNPFSKSCSRVWNLLMACQREGQPYCVDKDGENFFGTIICKKEMLVSLTC